MKLVCLVSLDPQGFGQIVGLLGRLGQALVGRFGAGFHARLDGVDLALVDDHFAGEVGNLYRVFPGAIQEAVLDVLVHLQDQLVQPALGSEIIVRQERIAGDKGASRGRSACGPQWTGANR